MDFGADLHITGRPDIAFQEKLPLRDVDPGNVSADVVKPGGSRWLSNRSQMEGYRPHVNRLIMGEADVAYGTDTFPDPVIPFERFEAFDPYQPTFQLASSGRPVLGHQAAEAIAGASIESADEQALEPIPSVEIHRHDTGAVIIDQVAGDVVGEDIALVSAAVLMENQRRIGCHAYLLFV
jgi:hypothetical protein